MGEEVTVKVFPGCTGRLYAFWVDARGNIYNQDGVTTSIVDTVVGVLSDFEKQVKFHIAPKIPDPHLNEPLYFIVAVKETMPVDYQAIVVLKEYWKEVYAVAVKRVNRGSRLRAQW